MDARDKETPFEKQFSLFLGFDWAKKDHDAVAVDSDGKVVLELSFPDTSEGWATLRSKLLSQVSGDLYRVAVAIETSCGPAVERLLEMDLAVFPINPKSAERYRQRKAPSGGKSDFLDAWSLADALRTDGHGWARLRADDSLTQELRLLCRDEVHLLQQRTALVNQLQEALHEYYPAALEAFDDWTSEAPWDFVIAFATPGKLKAKGKRQWEKFLHAHRLARPQTYQRRLDIFARAEQFCGSPAVTSAKSRLAVALSRQLKLLKEQLHEYRQAIHELFAQHPDHDLFGSLPGAGPKLAPRLLSELGQDRGRFSNAQALQCYVGTAPVTIQSGGNRWVKFRRACNKSLRSAVHHWANLSRDECVWAQAYYKHKRDQGLSHSCALRCLGQRWLKILWKMWQTSTPYDEALHTRNQVKHGSWIITLA